MSRYPVVEHNRDLRIDFLRGLVMWVLVSVHIEIFSMFNFLVWERVGIISGAEGFVLLSGFVLGQVHRRSSSFNTSCIKLFSRSAQLYRINVILILLILLLSFIPKLDLTVIMTFKNWYSGEVYDLFPSIDGAWPEILNRIFLLRAGPHQVQILGLYIVLLVISPPILWLFRNGKALLVIGISWILYVHQIAEPARPTGAQFEYAFPVLAWQLLYVHGLAVGYFRNEIAAALTDKRRRSLLIFCGAASLCFLLLAQNNPNSAFPEWARLSFVPEDLFNKWHSLYFSKSQLGILRIANYFTIIITAYWLLTRFWGFFNKTLGWLLIPIGQASLYVLIMHLIFVAVIAYIPGVLERRPLFSNGNIFYNTLIHISALMGLWAMVKYRFLFKYVPR